MRNLPREGGENQPSTQKPAVHPLIAVLPLRKQVSALFANAPRPTECQKNPDGSQRLHFANEDDERKFERICEQARGINQKIHELCPPHQPLPSPEERAAIITEAYGYKTEIVDRGRGRRYVVCTVPPEDMEIIPGVAWAAFGTVAICDDAPPTARRFLLEHELNHLDDRHFIIHNRGPLHWMWAELKANLHALYNPYGFMAMMMYGLKKNGMRGYNMRRLLKGEWGTGTTESLAGVPIIRNMDDLFGACKVDVRK